MEEMTQETKATAAEKQEARTFSQEEVNAIVQKRLAAVSYTHLRAHET